MDNAAYVTKPDLIPALLYDPFSVTYAVFGLLPKKCIKKHMQICKIYINYLLNFYKKRSKTLDK